MFTKAFRLVTFTEQTQEQSGLCYLMNYKVVGNKTKAGFYSA